MSDYKFEKNRLYGLLGKVIVETLKNHECILAGGAITSLFTGREINDYDIYFRSKTQLGRFIHDIWGSNLWVMAMTKKAVLINRNNVDLQAIAFDYFNSAEEIFKTFDYTVCMAAFDFKTEEFILHEEFLRHNSQRVLKFNKETAYPITSLLRIDKYKDKGYKISKAETIKVALTCMNLDIENWEDLGEQLGGMYGANYDETFKELKDTPFSLDVAIDHLSSLADEQIEFSEPAQYESPDELLDALFGHQDSTLVNISGKVYRVGYDGSLKNVNDFNIDEKEVLTASEFLKDKKLYKFVKKTKDGRYESFFKSNFEYEIGEEIKTDNPRGLFFNLLCDLNHSPYAWASDGVVLEVEFDPKDILGYVTYNREFKLSKCKVIRELSQAEIDELNDELPFT